VHVEKIERLSNLLSNTNILIGISGSCSAYRAVDLCRIARKHGANVRFVVSRSGLRFVTLDLLKWASNNDVYYPNCERGRALHIEFADWCNIYCIYPCTLNTMSKIASGICDTPVTLCALSCLGFNKKVLIVPAMNISLWNNAITRKVLRELKIISNIHIIEPDIVEDKAKLPSPERVIEKIIDLSAQPDLENLKILITAGSTREYIDPIKYISTPSSGLTGIYFAREASCRGAEVYLVCGYISKKCEDLIKDVYNVHIYRVKTTRDMYNTVREICRNVKIDIAIFTAAPLDYELETRFDKKIDSDVVDSIELKLRKAPKVIEAADNVKLKIAFKAEWNVEERDLVKRSLVRMFDLDLDMVIAHDVSKGLGFETEKDTVLLIDRNGVIRKFENIHKRELARNILTIARKLL